MNTSNSQLQSNSNGSVNRDTKRPFNIFTASQTEISQAFQEACQSSQAIQSCKLTKIKGMSSLHEQKPCNDNKITELKISEPVMKGSKSLYKTSRNKNGNKKSKKSKSC